MKKALTDLLNEAALQKWAGERAFERGESYFAAGLIVRLKVEDGRITAKVRGTHYYHVKLWAEADALAYECDCPVGRERERAFCKHCVAVGLAWLAQQRPDRDVSRRAAKHETTLEDIRAHLVTQDKNALVDILLDRASEDEAFQQRLWMRAAKQGSRAPDVATFRRAIDQAIRKRGFVHYSKMYEYTRSVEDVVDSLQDLLKQGHAAEVRELTEHALEAMESAIGHVDDSDGNMSGILDRLQDLHHTACHVAKPAPARLAKFLFDWEVSSDWEIFLGAAATYADVLGELGLAALGKLAEAKWAKVPPLAPGERDPERFGKRWRITHIMETLARQRGDIEALVAVKSRDLSDAYCFLRIAEIYKKVGKDDAALEWAERGARAFPHRTDGRLRAFLVEEYHRRERHDEAMAVAWAEFIESPGLPAYQSLKMSAARTGQWPAWREKALTVLRESITAEKRRAPAGGWGRSPRADHSPLVEVFLWESDIEAAWKQAKIGGCDDRLWLELAAEREKDHPEDAVEVYIQQLEPTLRYPHKDAYQEALQLLRRIRQLMTRVGKGNEFAALIQSVRARHKPRRNFMKLFDAEGWK